MATEKIKGSKPRSPQLSVAMVTTLARDLYGLHVQSCQELDSFVDRNYHLKVDAKNVLNDHIGEVCADGYVLKILNSHDSKHPADVRTEAAILQHVHGRGLNTPRLVPTACGQPFILCSFSLLGDKESYRITTENDAETKHAVRLLEYLPGNTLASVPLTDHLCYHLGQHAARLDTILQDFDDSNYKVPGDDWLGKIENLPSLRPLVDVIEDTEIKTAVMDVMDAFEARLLEDGQRRNFKRGYIHGDYNCYNVLVSRGSKENWAPPRTFSCSPTAAVSATSAPPPSSDTDSFSNDMFSSSLLSSPSEWMVSGLVDFGDSSKMYVLLEVAIAMSDVMLRCSLEHRPDLLAGHVLSGYLSQMALSRQEVDLLPLAISARFCQLVVLGHHTLSMDPHNQYVAACFVPVTRHFPRFWHVPQDLTIQLWKDVADSWGVKFPES